MGIINLTADHDGMVRFRKQLRDFIEERYHLFLDDETCPVLDWCDQVLNNRYYFLSGSKKKKKSNKGAVHNHIKHLLDWIFEYEVIRKLRPGQFISDKRRWFDTGYMGPFMAYWTKLPVLVYNKLVSKEKVNGSYKITESTALFFYRDHDNKVMKQTFNAVIHPFRHCLIIYFDGCDHFNWSVVRDGIARSTYTYHPSGDASDDVFVDTGGRDIPIAMTEAESGTATITDVDNLPPPMAQNIKSETKSPGTRKRTITISGTATVAGLDIDQPSPPKKQKIKSEETTPPTSRKRIKSEETTPPTSRKRKSSKKKIIIHPNPVSSPDQVKLTNEIPRHRHELWEADPVIDGERFVTWKNYNGSSVVLPSDKNNVMSTRNECKFSAENLDKLFHVVRTPKCNVSSFKIAWRKQSGTYDGADLIVPTLKKEINFVEHHFDIRFSNNRVLGCYKMESLDQAVRNDDVQSIKMIEERQLCDHPVDSKGMCKKRPRESRAPTTLAAYKECSCAHHHEKRDKSGICTVTAYSGFLADTFQAYIDEKPVSLCLEVSGNCTHRMNHKRQRLQGAARKEVIATHFQKPDGKLNDVLPQSVYDMENKVTNPEGKGNVRSIKQVYNAKQESKKGFLEMLGLTSKNTMKNFCQSIADLRRKDKAYISSL